MLSTFFMLNDQQYIFVWFHEQTWMQHSCSRLFILIWSSNFSIESHCSSEADLYSYKHWNKVT